MKYPLYPTNQPHNRAPFAFYPLHHPSIHPSTAHLSIQSNPGSASFISPSLCFR
ncbi:hypothetical protein B9Z19DRAFT_1087340 [Tuber borchii]|uniref:Uncharacterized protein n=1 Tax=Tuber borchii TaxID=42251 RepID=A0A2T6ZN74_TUBBO|nr:hypothetical protein B9Z19DRAFT_1087340 [Tuber borchii]